MAYYSTPLRKITNIITVIILLEKKKILLAQQDFTMYTYVKVINVQFVQKDEAGDSTYFYRQTT